MADDDRKHEPSEDVAPAGKGKSRRRPPPTIDLAATDVTPAKPDDAPTSDDAATAEPPVTPPPSDDAPSDDAPSEVPVLDVEGTAAPEAPPEPVHPTEVPGKKADPEKPKRPLGLVSGLILALVSGMLGGAVALAVVSTFSSAEQDADAITELEARALDLRQRVDALESRGEAGVAAGTQAPEELATRLDALESGLAALGGRVDAREAAPADAAFGGRVEALEQKVAALPAPAAAASPDEVAALGARLGALEQRVGAIPAPAPAATPEDIAGANARIGALEQRLAEVSSQQQTSGQGAAQLIALDALHDAIAEGRPFATELKASRALLGANADALAALEPAAGEGFASGPALAAQLEAATAPVAAPAPPAGSPATGDGVLDKLFDSARSLVTIRRSTLAAAGGSEDLATAQAALVRGDYAGAKAALDALPEAEKAAAAPILAAIEARQAALATVAGLSQQVLASFAGGNQ